MTSLVEIKAAIDRLSPREYCELMSMLHPSADDGWDRQIAADLAAGRLDGLIANAKAEIEAGLASAFAVYTAIAKAFSSSLISFLEPCPLWCHRSNVLHIFTCGCKFSHVGASFQLADSTRDTMKILSPQRDTGI